MDFCRNVAVSGDQYQQDQVLSPSSIPPSSSSNLALADPLDDLFPAHTTEVDVSLEWLSIFVEDCLSSSGICLPASELPTKNNAAATTAAPSPKPLQQQQQQQQQKASTTTTPSPPPSLEKLVVPGKARSKRKRASSTAKLTQTSTSLSSLTTGCWTTTHNNHPADTQLFHSDDPPLLQVQQAFWLADSQLIFPKKETTNTNAINTNSNKKAKANDGDEEEEAKEEETEIGKEVEVVQQQQQQQGRRCSHCLSQRTPQWRAGPLGPKTLCNACGVRYKSGRLLPEYRPAKSPTFVSYLHSNSHKKVLEMRMALMPSPSSLPK